MCQHPVTVRPAGPPPPRGEVLPFASDWYLTYTHGGCSRCYKNNDQTIYEPGYVNGNKLLCEDCYNYCFDSD